MHRSASTFAFALAASLAAGTGARAQCTNFWLPGESVRGTDYVVKSLSMWDPDGTGPLQPRLVVGGYFSEAGGVAANRIASWDQTTDTWSAIGAGVTIPVDAIVAMPNGDLFAGGSFGGSYDGVRHWNGSSWSPPLGGGLQPPSVRALTALPNGDVVAGGAFSYAPGVLAEYTARWNGTLWSPLGS